MGEHREYLLGLRLKVKTKSDLRGLLSFLLLKIKGVLWEVLFKTAEMNSLMSACQTWSFVTAFK